jgi:hypothetical protein
MKRKGERRSRPCLFFDPDENVCSAPSRSPPGAGGPQRSDYWRRHSFGHRVGADSAGRSSAFRHCATRFAAHAEENVLRIRLRAPASRPKAFALLDCLTRRSFYLLCASAPGNPAVFRFSFCSCCDFAACKELDRDSSGSFFSGGSRPRRRAFLFQAELVEHSADRCRRARVAFLVALHAAVHCIHGSQLNARILAPKENGPRLNRDPRFIVKV